MAFRPATIYGITLSRTRIGVTLEPGQAVLVLLAAVGTGLLAVRLVNNRLVKRGILPPAKETEAQRGNRRLRRRTALALCAVLAVSAFLNNALIGFGDTARIAKGTEFSDFDSFRRYMNKPVDPTYESEGMLAPETAAAESPIYYENDTPVYRSQTEGVTIEDDDGKLLCNFIWRNRSVVSWRLGSKPNGYLPVTAYTQEAMTQAAQKAKCIDAVFYGVYAAEVIAAAVYCICKREK